jgi:mono/diheme cytochrome c family protein
MSQKQNRQPRRSLWAAGLLLLPVAGGLLYFQLSPSAPLEALAQNPTPTQLEQGRTLFAQNCAACHGPQAVGQLPKSPKGGIQADGTYLAPALNGNGHAWHHPNQVLFETIKHGSIAPDSPMRGFSGRLNDEEIVAVIQYFKSLWPATIRERHMMMMEGS